MTQYTQQILNDPSISYYLKDSLRRLLERDILDALNDAELLAQVMRHEFKALNQAYD